MPQMTAMSLLNPILVNFRFLHPTSFSSCTVKQTRKCGSASSKIDEEMRELIIYIVWLELLGSQLEAGSRFYKDVNRRVEEHERDFQQPRSWVNRPCRRGSAPTYRYRRSSRVFTYQAILVNSHQDFIERLEIAFRDGVYLWEAVLKLLGRCLSRNLCLNSMVSELVDLRIWIQYKLKSKQQPSFEAKPLPETPLQQYQMISHLISLALITPLALSCTTSTPIITPSNSLSNTLSTLPQTDLQNNFKSYLYDPSTSNLSSFAMSLKPYIIPIILLLTVQVLSLLYVIGFKIYRWKRPNPAPTEYTKMSNIITLITTALLALGIVAVGVVMILAVSSATTVVDNAGCKTSESVDQFLDGETGKWIGVRNVAGTAGNVSLQFNNNVRQLRTGLMGLKINGTKLGIPVNGTFPTIEAVVNAGMSNYLERNTSANTRRYPICQTTPFTVPSPDDITKTVTLQYQSRICTALTTESAELVTQARSLDNMLSMLTNLTGNRSNINNNITAISTSYNSFVNSSNFDKLYLTMDLKTGSIMAYILSSILILFSIYLLTIYITRSEKLFKSYPLVYILLLGSGCLSAAVNVYYITTAAGVQASCGLYDSALSNSSLFDEISGKLNVTTTLTPVYTCVNNPTATFLNSSQMESSFVALGNLTTVNGLYKGSIPADILNSKSINYTTEVLDYLSDMSTMAISGNISIAEALTNLNKIGDYTFPNSTQSPLCNISQDQFVFTPLKCTRTLLDPTDGTDVTTTSPCCIQIPTNNRTSGTINTALNMMQHLYTLSATGDCTSIPNIFNSTKNCFLKTRATALFSTPCASVMTAYMAKLEAMVSFAMLAGEYTDAFVQNLRNYLGIYLTLSSNMSSFYLATNVSNMVGAFANSSANITSMSNCSYPTEKLQSVKSQYCQTVTPSLFQVWIVGFAGMATLCLLTVFVIISQTRLTQMIAAPKIVAKASMDSALGFDQSGVEHHNITEENALPQHVVENLVENILEQMESRSRDGGDGRSLRSENRKERSQQNSGGGEKQNVFDIEKRPVSGHSEKLGVKRDKSSKQNSVKKANSEVSDHPLYVFDNSGNRNLEQSKQQILLAAPQQHPQPPQQHSHHDQIININLQQKLDSEHHSHSDHHQQDNKTDAGKMQYTTQPNQYKDIVYGRNIVNIILDPRAHSNKLFRRRRPPREEPGGRNSAMEIHDFGSVDSQERKKRREDDNEEDETTVKKKKDSDSSNSKIKK